MGTDNEDQVQDELQADPNLEAIEEQQAEAVEQGAEETPDASELDLNDEQADISDEQVEHAEENLDEGVEEQADDLEVVEEGDVVDAAQSSSMSATAMEAELADARSDESKLEWQARSNQEMEEREELAPQDEQNRMADERGEQGEQSTLEGRIYGRTEVTDPEAYAEGEAPESDNDEA